MTPVTPVGCIIGPVLTVVVSVGLCGRADAQAFSPSMAGWFASLQAHVSSLRISTRQTSLGAEQGATAATSAAMGLASAIVEQEAAITTRGAVARYESMHNDLTTGLCTVADAQQGAGRATMASFSVDAELDDFERRWLARGGDRSDTLIATHRMRRTALCSEGERALGLCEGAPSFGVPVAADGDASSFLARRSYGSAEVDLGSVFVDTVAPFPTIATAADAASGSVAELVERADRRRELALVALARTGLTDVLLRGLEGGTE